MKRLAAHRDLSSSLKAVDSVGNLVPDTSSPKPVASEGFTR